MVKKKTSKKKSTTKRRGARTIYKAKSGAYFNDAEAAIIGKRLEQLSKGSTGVTAEDVVTDAESPRSPLHRFFDWDDSIAGHKWRLQQARVLIGGIIEVVSVEGQNVPHRSFMNVRDAGGQNVYVPLKKAIQHEPYAVQLIDEAANYINHFSKVLKLLKKHMKRK